MSFLGYERPDGSVGVRNYVAVISAGSCINEVPVRIAERVKNIVPIIHNEGDLRKKDNEQIIRTLVGIGVNPNVAACIVVGLGCEIRPPDMLGDKIAKSGKPVEVLTVEKIGDFYETINRGIDTARKLVYYTSKIRRRVEEASSLTIGVKCAGSDTSSGLAGNPSVGAASDMIIEHGGTVIISETAEIIGVPKLLPFSVKFINYNNFNNIDTREAVHDWRGGEDLRCLLCGCEEVAYSGKIKYIKTPGGKYRYPESEIKRLLGEQMPKGKAAVYARVSSADRKEDLERQSRDSLNTLGDIRT